MAAKKSKKIKEDGVALNVLLPRDLKDNLDRMADDLDSDPSKIVRRLIREAYQKHIIQAAIRSNTIQRILSATDAEAAKLMSLIIGDTEGNKPVPSEQTRKFIEELSSRKTAPTKKPESK